MGFFIDNTKKFGKLKQDKKWTDYRKLAEKGWDTGDYDCLELLAEDYYYGRSIETNYAKAFQIFNEIVEKTPEQRRGDNYGNALLHLALCYYFAEGVKRDVEKAINYCTLALKYNPSIFATYYTIAIQARKYYDEGNAEKVGHFMDLLYSVYEQDGDVLSQYSYAVWLIQGEPFPRKMYDGTNANGKDVAKGIEIIKKNAEQCEYGQYYLSLLYCFGCPPYLNADAKKATKYMEASAEREFWPATLIKSKAFENVRDDKVVYEKTTTTYYTDGTQSSVTETIVENKYGRWHDAMDKLSLIIANSHVHQMERDLLQLHDYAPLHVDWDAKPIRKYPKDFNAIIVNKGPVAHKDSEARDVINGKYPMAQPLYEIDYAKYPVDYLGKEPIPQSQEENNDNSADTNLNLNEVADKLKDGVKAGVDKLKGFFSKFKK